MDALIVLLKGLLYTAMLGIVVSWELERRLRNVFQHRESRAYV